MASFSFLFSDFFGYYDMKEI